MSFIDIIYLKKCILLQSHVSYTALAAPRTHYEE